MGELGKFAVKKSSYVTDFSIAKARPKTDTRPYQPDPDMLAQLRRAQSVNAIPSKFTNA